MKTQELSKFIQFRFKQIGRSLKEVGIVRTIIIFAFLVATFIGFSKLIIERNLLLIPIYLALSLPFHLSRKDQSFLRKLTIPIKIVWATEYNLIAVPFTIFFAINQQWQLVLLGHLLTTLIIFIPNSIVAKQSSLGREKFITLIPKHLFEWRSYFRKRKYMFSIPYLLTLALSFSLFAQFIGILFLLGFLPEVYNQLESKELIEIYSTNSSFLSSKLKDHSVFIQLLFLPLYLLFVVFHYQFWYLLIYLIIIVELSVCFGLLYKYSRIQISKSNIHNQLPFAIFFIASIVFFPIGCFIIYLYWTKAQKMVMVDARN